MADSHDKSLLDRLNALKPTAVDLDKSTNALDASTTGVPSDEALSREDALAKRLKSLRESRDEAADPASNYPPPPYSETAYGTPSPKSLSQRLKPSSPPAKRVRTESNPNTDPAIRSDQADVNEHLHRDDDRTLEEILDGLVLDDDHWSVSEDDGDDSASRRVEELLANLGKKAGVHNSDQKDDDDDEDDDNGKDDASEDEWMTHQADDVLAKTMDELEFEGHGGPQPSVKPVDPPGGGTDMADSDAAEADSEHDDLALPAVPHTPTEDQPLPDLPITPDDTELSLPTVPTNLQDPLPASKAPDDPFESSIAARLAALKGPGHRPITTDAFGLPSAPTFHPEDRPVPKLAKRPGYSDADMKTWCIVCLEDATVRCVGCDGDVYCARCWREMHVGPSAGYDERGHAWEKFDPRRV